MSTIKSRQRWIRLEVGILLLLVTVLVFPDSPHVASQVALRSSVLLRVRAAIETAELERGRDRGDADAIRLLALSYASNQGYRRYMEGNPVELLKTMVDNGNVSSIKLLAWILRDSDPDQSARLYMQAADLGDETAQLISIRELGIDADDPATFMLKLGQIQLDRPGWKTSFNRYYRLLQTESASGNVEAKEALEQIGLVEHPIEN